MAKISVIIPCYNVENYVDRCLDSVVNQTIGIDNLEVICIDDASTDSTFERLCAWERKYPNSFIVIHCDENGRQGAARNIGINYASSDYIGFVDSDDWIEPDMYESLYNKAVSGNFDEVSCKVIREDGSHAESPKAFENQTVYFQRLGNYYIPRDFPTGKNGTFGSLCARIIKSKIIKDNELYFPEHIAYEDNYWGEVHNLFIGSLYIIDKTLYHYYVNNGSTIMQRNSRRTLDRLIIEPAILDKYKEIGMFDTCRDYLYGVFIERYYLNTLFMVFTRFDIVPPELNVSNMKEVMTSYFPNCLDDIKALLNTLTLDSLTKFCFEKLVADTDYSYDDMKKMQSEYLSKF